jgi:2-iminobutanoate/2-iminopropanoate deaminase
MMQQTSINATDSPQPAGGYAQAVAVEGAKRFLFISGQIPVTADGQTPTGFAAQAALAWSNVDAQLRAAGLTKDNLIKATIFLGDRKHAQENREARQAYLGDRAIALTVIITGIFDQSWLLEIEAIAAA